MSVRIPRILAAVYGSVWAVRPETLSAITTALHEATQHRRPVAALHDTGRSSNQDRIPVSREGTAILTIDGIIGHHLSALETECGGYDVISLMSDLDEIEANAGIQRVLLVLRTPGGVVTGVPEAAARINSFSKDIVAFTDGMSASAGYWLASQAQEVWMTPSAEVGSIGVYSAVVDESAAWAKEGYKLELMKAGAHKAAGIPGLPLSVEDKALMQANVDAVYADFTGAVVARRDKVKSESMQGQLFRGPDALAAGLADQIFPSLDQAIATMDARATSPARPSSAAKTKTVALNMSFFRRANEPTARELFLVSALAAVGLTEENVATAQQANATNFLESLTADATVARTEAKQAIQSRDALREIVTQAGYTPEDLASAETFRAASQAKIKARASAELVEMSAARGIAPVMQQPTGAGANTMSAEEFNKLPFEARNEFIRSGGKLKH